MIFYGDIAIPNNFHCETSNFPKDFFGKKGFANLEGPIFPDNSYIAKNVVFNSETSIAFLKEHSIIGVSLANNHITDLGHDLVNTKKRLSDNNISFGGYEKFCSKHLIRLLDGDKEYIIIPCGWDVIGCRYLKRKKEGVVPFELELLKTIKKLSADFPESYIVVFPHWNYELKDYPLPMQREIARKMIDCGANFVIGCHPHCCGGVEKYNSGIIAYSLGNFYFVSDKYMNSRLRFPFKSERELGLEIVNGEIVLHWFSFNRDFNVLNYEFSEKLDDSSKIQTLTPFAGFTDKQYIRWYRKNQKHSFLLPIFKKVSRLNWFKKRILVLRQLVIKILWNTGLKRRRSKSE